MAERKEINGYTTRSFIAMTMAVLFVILRIYGIELGVEETLLVEVLLQVAPLAFAIWAYIERIYGKATLVFSPSKLKTMEERNNVRD